MSSSTPYRLSRPPFLVLIFSALVFSGFHLAEPLAANGLSGQASSTDQLGSPDLELMTIGAVSNAVGIVHAGDDRLFIARQNGEILIYDGSLPMSTFLDISSLMGSGFEGGIKSIAFHPDYASNGFFFVHYSDLSDDSVIARYSVSKDPDVANPASGVILITVEQTTDIHRGGQIQFGPDGFLYIGFGDGGPQTDTNCNSQTGDRFQGKLLRIDVDQNVSTPPHYGIPAGNPFGGKGEPSAEVWALGLRQPWRFSFDRSTGDLYIADVGQHTREEIDFQPAASSGGENYGWRIMEGTTCHDPDPIDPNCPVATASCDDPSYTPPVLEYATNVDGNCSITGGYVYRGQDLPGLTGRYLYGDWCSGRIWAADNSGGPWTTEELSISLPGIITFGEDQNGELYLADGSTVYRLDSPAAIFTDGFESGDASVWSSQVP